ncbi:MAG TPA: DUF3341 domain-containing protein [Devosia sp.]
MARPVDSGLLAMFRSPEALLGAVDRMRELGLTALEGFTPYPVTGLPERLGARTRLPVWTFIGGCIGGAAIFGLQVYSVLLNYPINVGGRPLFSWPAFLVPTFECVVLGAALVAFFGMLIGNQLPRLHHPVFDAESFTLATGDRFYLLVGGTDSHLGIAELRKEFAELGAETIEEVRA